jgi:hypothetical protein
MAAASATACRQAQAGRLRGALMGAPLQWRAQTACVCWTSAPGAPHRAQSVGCCMHGLCRLLVTHSLLSLEPPKAKAAYDKVRTGHRYFCLMLQGLTSLSSQTSRQRASSARRSQSPAWSSTPTATLCLQQASVGTSASWRQEPTAAPQHRHEQRLHRQQPGRCCSRRLPGSMSGSRSCGRMTWQ